MDPYGLGRSLSTQMLLITAILHGLYQHKVLTRFMELNLQSVVTPQLPSSFSLSCHFFPLSAAVSCPLTHRYFSPCAVIVKLSFFSRRAVFSWPYLFVSYISRCKVSLKEINFTLTWSNSQVCCSFVIITFCLWRFLKMLLSEIQ